MMETAQPKQGRRWPRRLALGLLAILCVFMFAMCQWAHGMVDPKTHPDLARTLAHVLQPDGGSRSVGVLRKGIEPGAVVYIHGTPGTADNWAAYLRDPVDGAPAIAIDRLGFGASKGSGAVVSFADQAGAIAEVIRQQAASKPVVVGHSLGGPIAARLAADHPDLVGGLVLVAASLDPALESPRWFNYALAFPPVGWCFPNGILHSNDEIFAAEQETESLQAVLARVTCPVHLVHGEQDQLVPFANMDYAERELTSAAAVTRYALPGQDHFVIWTDEGVPTVRSAITAALRDRAAQLGK